MPAPLPSLASQLTVRLHVRRERRGGRPRLDSKVRQRRALLHYVVCARGVEPSQVGQGLADSVFFTKLLGSAVRALPTDMALCAIRNGSASSNRSFQANQLLLVTGPRSSSSSTLSTPSLPFLTGLNFGAYS